MNLRKPIQKQHERALVSRFLAFINAKNGTNFVVDSEPEPPEAIAKDGDKYIWIEVTDAFLSPEYAKDLYSYATPGENHVPSGGSVHINFDDKFAAIFVECVRKKLSKASYKSVYEAHGKGILIVGALSPFFDESAIPLIQQYQKASKWDGDIGYFDKIYIHDQNNFFEHEW